MFQSINIKFYSLQKTQIKISGFIYNIISPVIRPINIVAKMTAIIENKTLYNIPIGSKELCNLLLRLTITITLIASAPIAIKSIEVKGLLIYLSEKKPITIIMLNNIN